VSRVTIADVASAAGVSKTAVSFAFNNPDRLGHATLERVLGVAQDLGYTPHPAARALSTEHDLTLLLVPPLDGSLEQAIRVVSVDGFISLGLSPDDSAVRVLDRIGIPHVLVDSEGSAHRPAVNIDDEAGAEAAARHLLELGHRRIAILVLPPVRAQKDPSPAVTRRLSGYRKAIDAAGAPEPTTVTAGISVAAGGRAFDSLPRGRRGPTGVLAMSDMAAIGVLGAAEAARLRVPEDLSVVGFDDIPASAWTSQPLTTVRQPTVEKGKLAARILIQRMNGESVDSPRPLSTTLVVRKSTASVKGPRFAQ
jgi:DNA-binding LacI/PurR family transcriptional regulator